MARTVACSRGREGSEVALKAGAARSYMQKTVIVPWHAYYDYRHELLNAADVAFFFSLVDPVLGVEDE